MADVLGQEDTNGERSVPMDKVVMLIWQFRDDPTVVTFMARFVSKVSRNEGAVPKTCMDKSFFSGLP